MGAGPLMGYAFGVFSKTINTEFGWERSVLSLGLTCFLIGSGFGALALGHVINRWNVRSASITFLIIFSLAIGAIGMLSPSRWFVYIDFLIIGFFGSAACALPYSVSISGLFHDHRGLALGLMGAGGGLGGLLAPQYAVFLLTNVGWRRSFVIIAITIAAVSLIGQVFLVRDPPSVESSSTGHEKTRTGTNYLRQRPFWLLVLIILGLSFATWGVLPNVIPLLTDRGFSPALAATVLSSAGFAAWVGRLLVAYLMDRIFAPFITLTVLLLAALGMLLLGGGTTITLAFIASSLIGVAIGSESDIITYLVSRYFPQEVYSRVVGAMWVVWCWGGGMGTYVAGAVYDSSKSYVVALWLFGGGVILAAGTTLLLGPYIIPLAHRKRATIQRPAPIAHVP